MIKDSVERKLFVSDKLVVLSLAVLACMLWMVKYYWKKRHFFRLASAIPSCKTGLFGAVGDLAGKSNDGCLKQILQYLQHGPEVQKTWFGAYLVVLITKPEHFEIVLTDRNCLKRSHLFSFVKPYLGDGILTAPVDIWRKNRKLINPSFNQKVLNTFIPIFAEKCDILMENLEKLVGHKDIDIRHILTAYTLDSICETAMGATVEAQRGDNRYGRALEKFLEIVATRIFNVFYHPQIIFDMTKIGMLSNKLVTLMTDFSRTVITQQRAVFEQKKQEEVVIDQDNSKYKTFLNLLLEESYKGNHFTDKQLQDEVNTFISAGTDTTAIALSYCCLTLGLHPEFQQKVYEEATEVLGEDRYATKDDLTELKFTEMFIKETLRIFPVSVLTVRTVTGDTKIDDNLVIPEDTIVLLPLVHLHRNPKYWNDPLKFDPNRFLPEEIAKRHPYSYLPFSGGPRNCIGARYAMMNMKFVLSKMVRKFIVKTDYKCVEEVQMEMNFLSSPTHGYKISLEPRQ